MSTSEDVRENTGHLPISKKILGYGSIGIASAIIIHFTSGFAGDHLLLLALGAVFWIIFSSTMVWVLWELIVPMAGRKRPDD